MFRRTHKLLRERYPELFTAPRPLAIGIYHQIRAAIGREELRSRDLNLFLARLDEMDGLPRRPGPRRSAGQPGWVGCRVCDALSCPGRQGRIARGPVPTRPSSWADRTRPARAEGRASAHLPPPGLQLAELLDVSRPGPHPDRMPIPALCIQAGRDKTASVPGSALPK